MIDFHYETNFNLTNEAKYADWITRLIAGEGASIRQIDYVFCSDEYLLQLNKKYLEHESYTDILTFDYSEKGVLAGDIFISVERVSDNAKKWQQSFEMEILRVMAHGILHMLGYKDKQDADRKEMRRLEEEKIKLFHVEQ